MSRAGGQVGARVRVEVQIRNPEIDYGKTSGWLTINDGVMRLEYRYWPIPLRFEPIVHVPRKVTLIRPRIGVPWFNTSVVIVGDEAVAIATTAMWHRRRLRAALRDAGFAVVDVRTWLSVGELWRYAR